MQFTKEDKIVSLYKGLLACNNDLTVNDVPEVFNLKEKVGDTYYVNEQVGTFLRENRIIEDDLYDDIFSDLNILVNRLDGESLISILNIENRTDEQLVQMVINGLFGHSLLRMYLLGNRYDTIRVMINEKIGVNKD